MATRIPEGTSIEAVVDMVDATYAAVSGDPETTHLSPKWLAMRDEADAQAKKRSEADRALSRARIRLEISDAKWDSTVAAFGRAVVWPLLAEDRSNHRPFPDPEGSGARQRGDVCAAGA